MLLQQVYAEQIGGETDTRPGDQPFLLQLYPPHKGEDPEGAQKSQDKIIMEKHFKIVIEAVIFPIPFIKNKKKAEAEQAGKDIEEKAPFFVRKKLHIILAQIPSDQIEGEEPFHPISPVVRHEIDRYEAFDQTSEEKQAGDGCLQLDLCQSLDPAIQHGGQHIQHHICRCEPVMFRRDGEQVLDAPEDGIIRLHRINPYQLHHQTHHQRVEIHFQQQLQDPV